MGNKLIFYSFFLTCACACHGQRINSAVRFESAYEEFYNIIEQLISSKPDLTFVFVLRVKFWNQVCFRFLQGYSNAQVYIAMDIFIMKPRDREIVISLENEAPGYFLPWKSYSVCGHHNCEGKTQALVNLRLDKRVLIQVRELDYDKFHARKVTWLQHKLALALRQVVYPKFYRTTFIVFRFTHEDILHSSIQVRRSGRVIGNQIMKLDVIETDIAHVNQTFDSIQKNSNQTARFTAGFFGIFFPDGTEIDRVPIRSCLQGWKAFVHAYTYQPVRLAVPMEWSTRLVSNLPELLRLELPITLISLFALPIILSIRHRRSFLPTSSMFETALHLLSGDSSESLIRPASQTTFVLLICGLVSLLIQFPINLMKGEVVSSTQEQRIHHSNCKVLSCTSIPYRQSWFEEDSKGSIHIRDIFEGERSELKVRKENLENACSTDSKNTGGMMNWTKLALLLQYETICDEPELMKLQMAQLNDKLLFENIPASHETQPLCSSGVSLGGQVDYWEHMQTTNRVLEHALMKYQHLIASLTFKNTYDLAFWNHSAKNSDWEKAFETKLKVSLAIIQLTEGYEEYKMFGKSDETRASGMKEIFTLLLGYFILLLVASIVFVLQLTKMLVFKMRRFEKS